MLQMAYADILDIIMEKGEISREEVERRVREKTDMLSGLVSREGAAHIVANELGINLAGSASGRMKIGKVAPGMRDIVVVGRTVQAYEPRAFETNGRKGKVGALILGDETGTLRVTFWNEQAELLRNIKQGDVLKVEGGYAKEGMRGVEVHVNERSRIELNPPGESVEAVSAQQQAVRKRLNEISEKDAFVEIMATVVQAYEPRFYEVCPQCSRRARLHNEHFVCDTHGEVTPEYAYVMNLMMDDGTDTMRVVCFREQAAQALEKSDTQMMALREAPAEFENMRTDVLGAFLKVQGRVNRNEMFDRLELVARSVQGAKPEEEMAQFGKP